MALLEHCSVKSLGLVGRRCWARNEYANWMVIERDAINPHLNVETRRALWTLLSRVTPGVMDTEMHTVRSLQSLQSWYLKRLLKMKIDGCKTKVSGSKMKIDESQTFLD